MKVFLSYSHQDSAVLEQLHKHLAILRRQGHIETWFDRDILAGSELDAEIAENLESADLFFLLVSADFLDSSYCFDREMQRALQRHDCGEARVIPIIAEPCDWKPTKLGDLRALPKDGLPISEWKNRNIAYLDIVNELRRIVVFDPAQSTSSPFPISETGMVHPRIEAGPDPTTHSAFSSERPTFHHSMAAHAAPPSGFRIRRDFDHIHRTDFRDAAFITIRDFFQYRLVDLGADPILRGRFKELSATSFGCTVVNQALDHGTAHITVHSDSHHGPFGISFSYTENAPVGTANGFFMGIM